MSGKSYFSDMGEHLTVTDQDGRVEVLPRYGAWTWNAVKRRHEVAEVSNDLEALRAKYGDCPMVDMRPDQASDSASAPDDEKR